MKQSNKTFLLAACALAMLAPTPSSAALIAGSQLNINGDANVGATFLNWNCVQPGAPTPCTAGYGNFAVTPSTGSFLQYTNTFGEILSINNFSAPLGQPNLAIPNFIVFNLNNNLTIELQQIPLGTNTPSTNCVGVTHCTPSNPGLITPFNPAGLSAFNLDYSATGTAATFGIFGTVHENGTGQTANIGGTFTAQFAGMTPDQVLALLGPNGIHSTYSANMNLTITPIPEPMTGAMIGFGLLGVGLFRRFRS